MTNTATAEAPSKHADFVDTLLDHLHGEAGVAVTADNAKVLSALADKIDSPAKLNPLGIRVAHPGSSVDDTGRVTFPNEGTSLEAHRQWILADKMSGVLHWLRHGRNPAELASAIDSAGVGHGDLREHIAPIPPAIPAQAPPGTMNITPAQLDEMLANAASAAAKEAAANVIATLQQAANPEPPAESAPLAPVTAMAPEGSVNVATPGPLGAVPSEDDSEPTS